MRYQVFIERTKDPAAVAIMRTAAAIAARFGLPAQDLAQRLAAGRFRVKSGVERDAAERLVAELEAMGAVCSIADEAGNPVQLGASTRAPSQASGLASAGPARAPSQASALSSSGSGSGPPGTASRATPPGPARAQSSSELQTGLAAALAVSTSEPDLGALGASAAPLSLATLDGEEDAPPPAAAQARSFAPVSFAPPPEHEQALQLAVDIRKPKAEPPPPAAVPPPPSRPSTVDPESLGPAIVGVAIPPGLEQSNTELAIPGAGGSSSMAAIRTPVERRASTQRPMTAPLADRAGGATSASGAENPAARVMSVLADSPRARFVTGVLLALFLGFVPAHLVASMREGSAYAEIDATVRVAQADIVDLEQWNRLDETRAMLLARKQSKQRNIALSSMALWALASGGLAFLWSRKIGF